MPKLRITGDAGEITAAPGAVLSDVLRQAGYAPDSPCGGQGSCGKCKVLADFFKRNFLRKNADA